MQRRTFRHTGFTSRTPSVRRRKWQWVRETVSSGSPNGAQNDFDMLGTFKTQMGINLNLPDIVIWRILLKISIRFSLLPAVVSAEDGLFVSVFCDKLPQNPTFNAVISPYDEQYMMWDTIYYAELLMNGGSAVNEPAALYGKYDIRTHRKLENIDDTLQLQLASVGNLVQTEVSYTASILLKMP